MGILKRRKGGTPARSLQSRASGGDQKFHLVHVTGVGFAREIIRAGQIDATLCKVFEEDLVYFFAMRPAYKLREAQKRQEIIDYFPFVFLVDADHLGPPFHVYPFDTGGALDGAFDDGASPGVYLEDYALEETLQAVNNHIEWAFGSAANYYDGKVRRDFGADIPDWDTGPKTFAKIARLAAEGSNRPDRRASAIEIAYDRHITLDHVKFAVLPEQFLESPMGNNSEMLDKLTDAGISWDTYQWRPNRPPSDFHPEINKIVRKYLQGQGEL
ncbi:hypothetical protein EHI46_24195 [Rhizobium leguminosarum]|uniref:hypothetical protein n=1 Tax=Rhizobium leguminosarum TaxID=384 RepID=UPI000FF6F9D9|nr:hypothetical protein [Rhizobium leguminosarum]RWY68526.1 hypothetical protein EHI46_24195 [Rhizobium leguminosarum]